MRREARILTPAELDKRVGLKAVGRLGYGQEPRATVHRTITDVFHARTATRMIELAQERDGKLQGQPPMAADLATKLAGADQALPEDVRMRGFKTEVVGELIRARIPGHTYLEAIASMCGDIIKQLYQEGFDDQVVVRR